MPSPPKDRAHRAYYLNTGRRMPPIEGTGKFTTLINWANSKMDGFQVRNLDKDWQDGLAFLALYNGIKPDLVDMAAVDPKQQEANLVRGIQLFKVRAGLVRG